VLKVAFLVADPSVKRRGRGFNPTSDGPAQDGVKNSGKFDLLPDGQSKGDELATQDKASKCESRLSKVLIKKSL
jgi:hypothetical protein